MGMPRVDALPLVDGRAAGASGDRALSVQMRVRQPSTGGALVARLGLVVVAMDGQQPPTTPTSLPHHQPRHRSGRARTFSH